MFDETPRNIPVEELFRVVTDAIAAIPSEFRSTAVASLDSSYDESARLTISYVRLETPEEVQARVNADKRWQADQDRRERALYEQLRRKFE